MADKIKLSAQKRELFGKKVKRLRQEGLVPANVYGSKVKSVAIKISYLDLKKVYKQAGETSVINLLIEGEKETRPVLISDIQANPVSKQVLHIDLRQVDLSQKISANVPIEIIGESEAVVQGAVLVTPRDEIEVEALPNDIPEKIELDISTLKQMGDTITVADIKVDKKKVKIKLEAEELLVQLQEQAKEEEPAVEEVSEEEGEEAEAEANDDKAKEEASAGDEKAEEKETKPETKANANPGKDKKE